MKAIICDKCGLSITDEEVIKETLRLDLRTDKVGKWDEMHLCDSCRKKLFSWFKE